MFTMLRCRLPPVPRKHTKHLPTSLPLFWEDISLERLKVMFGGSCKESFPINKYRRFFSSSDENNDEFIPFFQAVDAYMDRKKLNSEKATNRDENEKLGIRDKCDTLETLFDSIEKKPMKESTSCNLSTNDADESAIYMIDPVTKKKRTILDAFPIPSPSIESRNPNFFDKDSYDEYVIILNESIASSKTGVSHKMSEWLRREERFFKDPLPKFNEAIREDGVNPKDLEFRDELEEQRVSFLKYFSVDEKDYKSAELILTHIGRVCARRAKSLPLEIVWEKVKEAGMNLSSDSLSNFLYVVATYPSEKRLSFEPLGSIFDVLDSERLSSRNSESFNKDGVEEDLDQVDISEEIAAFHDCFYEPTEQSATVRVKALVKKGKAKSAEKLLERSGIKNLRLRSYQPILKKYIQQGDISSVLSLYGRMRSNSDFTFDAETSIQVIASVAEKGYFHHTSPPINGIKKHGFLNASGPKLLDQLAMYLAEDTLEISSALAKRLHTAIQKGFHNKNGGQNLEELHPLAPLKEENEFAGDEIIASRVSIDKSTGLCPRSGARLRLITLGQPERKVLRDKLLKLADTEQKKFMNKHKHGGKTKATASNKLQSFSVWLDKRKGKPFTAIIDGPNVAYYLQNFDDGQFNFHQIQFMVDTLEKMNEIPLVILPRKYVQKKFLVVRGNGVQRQVISEDEWAILNKLRDAGKLYLVPQNNNDDFYWMVASLSEQLNSRKGVSLDVPVNDPNGRWPGIRPMLVTNDQMRDHKLGLVDPRLFGRWYASHIVNFNFTGFVGNECVDDEILFSPADFFSREIQSNPSGRNDFDDTVRNAWHFPVSDWEIYERFCLRI